MIGRRQRRGGDGVPRIVARRLAAVLDVIAHAQRETGLGVLLITHDHTLARHWCHHIRDIHSV